MSKSSHVLKIQNGSKVYTCDLYTTMAEARANQDEGVNRFAIVTAGRALTGQDFEKALHVYQRMHKELSINLCASMGFISREQFRRLKEAGDKLSSQHRDIPQEFP